MENKFEWHPKYSSTDKPDKQNRWGRVCIFKGYKIASIYMIQVKGKAPIYEIYDSFPSSSNDMSTYCGAERNFEKAKKGVESRFTKFLNKCNK